MINLSKDLKETKEEKKNLKEQLSNVLPKYIEEQQKVNLFDIIIIKFLIIVFFRKQKEIYYYKELKFLKKRIKRKKNKLRKISIKLNKIKN